MSVNAWEQLPRERSIGAVVRDFVADVQLARAPAVARRYAAVGAELIDWIDTTSDAGYLTDEERLLIAAARQFGGDAAAHDLVTGEALLWALPAYLRHCLDDVAAPPGRQRDRAAFVRRLVHWMIAERVIDRREHSCTILDLDGPLRRLRAVGSAHPAGRAWRMTSEDLAAGSARQANAAQRNGEV